MTYKYKAGLKKNGIENEVHKNINFNQSKEIKDNEKPKFQRQKEIEVTFYQY